MCKYTKQRLQKTFAKSCYEAFLVASDFLGLYYFKYQRSTYELISLPGHLYFPLSQTLITSLVYFVYQICLI